MANRQSTLSQFSRPHSSVRSSRSDVFGDGFALSPFVLADGHRPSSAESDEYDRVHAAYDPPPSETSPRHSVPVQQPSATPMGTMRRSNPSRSSTAHLGAIPSRQDSRVSQLSRPQTMASVSDISEDSLCPPRSTRTISTFGLPRAQSPYQGPTGPSQPYAMYAQDTTLTRNPSSATTSTLRRPELAYAGPSGPTQPYGMYAQNTVSEDAHNPFNDTAFPVARFPVPQPDFQRRLGPDGEDADDLIGPDGYTEQLPPYTRYANGIPPKYDSAATSAPHSPQERAVSPDMMDYEFQNQPVAAEEPLNRPHSRDSPVLVDQIATNPFTDSSFTQVASTSEASTEKDGSFKERLYERGRRRACGGHIPCWLLLLFLLAIFFSVLLGGIIGGLLAHRHGVEEENEHSAATSIVAPTATVTATNAYDAVPLLTVPTNLPALPTGSFGISLQNATIASNTCLVLDSQNKAWDCPTGADLTLQINLSSGPNPPVISLTYPAPSTNPIKYGAQPPQLQGTTNLYLMDDRSAYSKGPAYHFQQTYNKTVILREGDLQPGHPDAKRSIQEPSFSNMMRRWLVGAIGYAHHADLVQRDDSSWTAGGIAKPYDKTWYCYWPYTILEAFIYIQQNESPTSVAASGSASPTSTTGIAYQLFRRQAVSTSTPYPKSMKILERRLPHTQIPPYCQKMQILNTNQPAPVPDPATGNPIIIQLNELEPLSLRRLEMSGAGPSAGIGSMNSGGGYIKRQASDEASDCECEWVF